MNYAAAEIKTKPLSWILLCLQMTSLTLLAYEFNADE